MCGNPVRGNPVTISRVLDMVTLSVSLYIVPGFVQVIECYFRSFSHDYILKSKYK